MWKRRKQNQLKLLHPGKVSPLLKDFPCPGDLVSAVDSLAGVSLVSLPAPSYVLTCTQRQSTWRHRWQTAGVFQQRRLQRSVYTTRPTIL